MKLIRIENSKFSLAVPEEPVASDDIRVGFMPRLSAETDNGRLYFTLGVRYLFKEVVMLECVVLFVFGFEDLANVVALNEDNKLIIKGNILPSVVNIAIGTIRGVMAAKTEGTPLAEYPLPIMDARNILKLFATQENSEKE